MPQIENDHIGARIDKELKARLVAAAAASGIPRAVSIIIKAALREWLDHYDAGRRRVVVEEVTISKPTPSPAKQLAIQDQKPSQTKLAAREESKERTQRGQEGLKKSERASSAQTQSRK